MNKFLLAALPLLIAAPAFAAPQAVQLVSSAQVEKHVVTNGRDEVVLRKPDNVLPGDRIVFETNYRNTGAVAATRFVVTNPLPSAVAWTGDSSTGASVSVDGGKTYGALGGLTVKGTDGRARAAAAADVTHIRWTLASIAPGAAGSVKYRGVVR